MVKGGDWEQKISSKTELNISFSKWLEFFAFYLGLSIGNELSTTGLKDDGKQCKYFAAPT